MYVLAAAKAPAIPALQSSATPLRLVVLYLFFEFGRPQEILPAIGSLHLPGVLTALLALALCASGRFSLSDTPTALFAALLALMALHIPIALNNYWALETARSMFGTFIAYLAVIAYADSLARIGTLVTAWLATHVYLAVIGIVQGGHGVGGFLGDENDFAMALTMAIPFAFFLALAHRRRRDQIAYYSLILLFAAATVLTNSRGGFIALAGTGVYCWLRSSAKAASAALVALSVLFIAYVAPSTYWSEIQTIQQGTQDPTAEDRIYQWKIGWKMFVDNPIMGVGQGNFPYEFRRYEVEGGFSHGLHGRSRAGRAAHSLYFTLLPELGLLGIALWLLILYHFFRETRLTRHLIGACGPPRSGASPPLPRARGRLTELEKAFHLTMALEASAVAYLISGLFLSVLYYPTPWLLLGFAVTLRKAVGRACANDPPSH